MDIERCFFFNPHFWPFKNHWTCQKSYFLIRRVLKETFFYLTSPQGVLQNKSQLSNLQNGHREMLFFTPHFWPFTNYWKGQKSCFLIRRVLKKPFFLSDLPTGGLVLPKDESVVKPSRWIEIFLTPHFWPFKNCWTCQKSCFLIRRVLKKLFFYLTSPRGSCFAKIRVSC